MPKRFIYTLRMVAATLVICSGSARVASLWFRELDQQSVLALMVGAIYLITGIGLFGQSRFALFVAIIACSTTSWLMADFFSLPGMHPVQLASVVADSISVLICAWVLWQVRGEPSV
jgi:uncharacterized membrane protein (DUF2068 family)